MAATFLRDPERAANFGRLVLSLAKNQNDLPSARGFAAANFGADSPVATVLRAAVASGTLTDASWAGAFTEYTTMTNEFLELVRPRSIIGQLALRNVPLNVRVHLELDGAVGYWSGEGQAKALTSSGLDTIALPVRKICALAVVTREVIAMAPSAAVPILTQILARAVAKTADESFISDAAATNNSPAGVLDGVSAITSSGDAVADLGALVESFEGDFSTAAFIMRPGTAVALAMIGARSGTSTFVDLGARGGQLFGLPCITSTHIPNDTGGSSIILVDAQQILLASGTLEIATGRSATLEMVDNPSSNSATATGTTQVSMFASNSTALRVERQINWQRARIDAVSWLSGVNYTSVT